jgi:hypothetical protein
VSFRFSVKPFVPPVYSRDAGLPISGPIYKGRIAISGSNTKQ